MNYSVIKKEILAIFWAASKFQQYQMKNKFLLVTDHKLVLTLFGEHKGITPMQLDTCSDGHYLYVNLIIEFNTSPLKRKVGQVDCLGCPLSQMNRMNI